MSPTVSQCAEPKRIQLRRTKGFNLQEYSHCLNGLDAVSVARPHRFGNPYKIGDTVAGFGVIYGRADAVKMFDRLCFPDVSELRGKNLACWCPLDGEPCHADVLLKRANSSGARP